MCKLTDKEVAAKMIATMEAHGISPDEMLKILKLAREKYNEMKKTNNQ